MTNVIPFPRRPDSRPSKVLVKLECGHGRYIHRRDWPALLNGERIGCRQRYIVNRCGLSPLTPASIAKLRSLVSA